MIALCLRTCPQLSLPKRTQHANQTHDRSGLTWTLQIYLLMPPLPTPAPQTERAETVRRVLSSSHAHLPTGVRGNWEKCRWFCQPPRLPHFVRNFQALPLGWL